MSILINGKEFVFDPEFQKEVDRCTWFINKQGYAQTTLPAYRSCTGMRETIGLHQLVTYLYYRIPLGCKAYIEWGYQIDHINHDLTDNRMENLQFLPKGLNKSKQSKVGKSSQYNGVTPAGRKWQARLPVNGTNHYIGLFDTELEAAKAHDNKIIELGLKDERMLNF